MSYAKINVKSSIEAELVGISDYLPVTIWMRMCLEAQGYSLWSNILHQDNQSTICLAKNGYMSASKQSNQINIQYFFVKHCINTEQLTIQHCPMDQMLTDFFTKPLQGSLFCKLCDMLLCILPISALLLPVHSEEHAESQIRDGSQIVETGAG
mmetsp:Transcript_34490/g.52948  ORF Transcript_34490/g.52948 Transcript_34490/m.52948 type:complete len:153 (+) Transcript_34490:854-1312(+)